jgi:hypothetical protein
VTKRGGGAGPFPVRGVAGGFRDPWDGPDPAVEARASLVIDPAFVEQAPADVYASDARRCLQSANPAMRRGSPRRIDLETGAR